jgi:hypothetical protein
MTQKQKEVRDWIQAHGSENLRLRSTVNLPITAQYARERARLEFPGWKLISTGTYRESTRVHVPSAILRDLRDRYSDPRYSLVQDGWGRLYYRYYMYLDLGYDLVKRCPLTWGIIP